MHQKSTAPEGETSNHFASHALLRVVAATAFLFSMNTESRADVVDLPDIVVPGSHAEFEAAEAPTSARLASSNAVVAAEAATSALSRHVTKASSPAALRTAFVGYFKYRNANPERVRNPYLYYVDLGLDSQTARGYLFDMKSLELVEGPFMVAHGRGSSEAKDGVPTLFSNTPGSNASSLGLYLAGALYTFNGKSGGKSYTSTGLRLRGESGAFNDAAEARKVVAHGAPYVTADGAGRSEGCPAMEQARAARLLPMLADGGVVFLYSPNDERWLRDELWIRE